MRCDGGVNHACRLAGLVVIAVLLAACGRHGVPKEYGLGSTGSLATPGSPQEFAVNVGDLVHFQEDSSALTGEARSILLNQVRWLNHYTQYNDHDRGPCRRAGHARVQPRSGCPTRHDGQGLPCEQRGGAARIRTISYGKERPIATCDDVSCWNQNRRAQTVLNDAAIARNY